MRCRRDRAPAVVRDAPRCVHQASRDSALSCITTLLIGKVVGGIDPRQQEQSELRRNLLNIDSLDSLKQKLTKVIIVALIVTAFKLMVSMEVTSVSDLLQYCGGVLMLAFSSWLISRSGHQHS